MNYRELVVRAVEEPTLAKALSWAATHENERAVAQALRADATGVSTATTGQQWDTCFEFLFGKVLEAWRQKAAPEPATTGETARLRSLIKARIAGLDEWEPAKACNELRALLAEVDGQQKGLGEG